MSRAKSLLWALVFFQVASSAAFATISFVPTEPFAVSRRPDLLAAGDFTRDGLADLAVVASASDEVDIVISAPEGGFLRAFVVPLFGTRLDGVAVADLNQDTLADIVLFDQRGGLRVGHIWILLGKGNGTFQDPYQFQVSNSPSSPVLSDFDLDGDVDIAYTDSRQQQLYIYLNDGGNPPLFTLGGMLILAKKPEWLAGGRFNRDVYPDLMALNTGGPRGKDVTFVRNDGVNPGSGFPVFSDGGQFMVGENPWALIGVDVDADEVTDAVMLNNPTGGYSSTDLQVMFSRGNGLFDGPVNTALTCPTLKIGYFCRAGVDKQNLGAGDFDGDGITDFVVTQQEREVQSGIRTRVFARFVRTVMPGPRFLLKSVYDVANQPYALAVGDFGGDEKPDVVIGTRSDSRVTMLINVSTTPRPPGEVCNNDEDCESEVCLDGICCEEVCAPDSTCAVPGHEGECYPLRFNGEVCTYDIECLSNHCTDGVCCDVAECPGGERCSICGLEGTCNEPLMPGEFCCNDDLSCTTNYCTDDVCCRVRICPEGDVCGADGFCVTAPTATPTPLPLGEPCDRDEECQSGYCTDGVCCTVPNCPPGYYCSSLPSALGECVIGTRPPTRTPTPTRIPSVPPTLPTPTCPPGFEPSGGLCTSVSRGGGCAIDPTGSPGAGAAVAFLLLPAALWLCRRRRRGE